MPAAAAPPLGHRLKTPLPPSSFKTSDSPKASPKATAFHPSTPPLTPSEPPSSTSLSLSPTSPPDTTTQSPKSPRAIRELISIEPWSTEDIDMDLSAATTLLSSPQTHPTHRQGSTPNVTASATKLVGHSPSSERNAWPSGIEAPIASMAHMMRGGLPQPTSQVDLLPLPLWERPPQVALDTSPQKMDPEMKIFLDAFASRRQTVRVATAPSSPAKMVTPTLPPSMPESSQLAARPKTTHAYSSVLRMHQMGEIEEIRLAFERHRLSFENQVFERALLIPEDKTTAECVAHLPLPGSRLPDNPLLAQKSLLFKMSSTLSTKKPRKKAKKKKKAKMKAKK